MTQWREAISVPRKQVFTSPATTGGLAWGTTGTRLLSAVHRLPSQQASNYTACPTFRHHPLPSSPMAHSVHGLHHRPAAHTPTQRRHPGGGRLLHQNGTLPAYHHHSHGASVEPVSSSTASAVSMGCPSKSSPTEIRASPVRFGRTLMEMWGTEAALSTAFHPQRTVEQSDSTVRWSRCFECTSHQT
jgi:hypothetical protein